MQKIIVNDLEWQYEIGSIFLILYHPTSLIKKLKKSSVISLTDLIGIDWDTFQRMKENGTFEIKPCDIKRHILRKLEDIK